MPCGRFFSVGSSLTFAETSPWAKPGARSAPIDRRRIWFERWIVVGPEPNPMSAIDFNGTEPPLEVGTGKILKRLDVAPGILGQRHGDRDLAVRQ